jgi:hypothetical protein
MVAEIWRCMRISRAWEKNQGFPFQWYKSDTCMTISFRDIHFLFWILFTRTLCTTKHLTMLFYPSSRHFLSFRFKYLSAIPLSNTLSPRSPLDKRAQVPHTEKTTGDISILYSHLSLYVCSKHSQLRVNIFPIWALRVFIRQVCMTWSGTAYL